MSMDAAVLRVLDRMNGLDRAAERSDAIEVPLYVPGVVNARQIPGVAAGGVADCWAAVQAYLTNMYADGGGVLYFPRGTYRFSKALRIYAGTTVQGDGIGATVLLYDDPTDAQVAAVSGDDLLDLLYGMHVVTPFCGFASAIALHTTSTIAAGDRRVRLNTNGDTSYFAVGDVVQLYSDHASYTPNGGALWASSPMGVLTTRILAKETVAGNNYLWLEDAIPWTYTQPAALPKLRYRLFASNPGTYASADRASVRDLTLAADDGAHTGVQATLGARNRSHGIYVNGAEDVRITNVRASRFRYRGIATESTRSIKIVGCAFDQIVSSRINVTDGDVRDGCGVSGQWDFAPLVAHCTVKRTGWGVVFTSAAYPKIIGNHVTGRSGVYELGVLANATGNKTPGVDPDGDAADNDDVGWKFTGRGMKLQYASTHGLIVGNTIADSTLFGIGLIDSAYCAAVDNDIVFNGVDASEFGIFVGGSSQLGVPTAHHCTVARNTVRGGISWGVYVLDTTTSYATYHAITGNAIAGTGQSTATAGIEASSVSGVTIDGNRIDSGTGTAIVLSDGAARNHVSGGTISGSAGAITTTAGAGMNLLDLASIQILAGALTLHDGDRPSAEGIYSVDSANVTASTFTTATFSAVAATLPLAATSVHDKIEVEFVGSMTTPAGVAGYTALSIDGGAAVAYGPTVPVGQSAFPIAFKAVVTGLSIATHTFTLQIRCSAPDATGVKIAGSQGRCTFTVRRVG